MSMNIEPFSKQTNKPWGYEITYTPKGLERVGKIIFIKAGERLSLQYHDRKEETMTLFSGSATLQIGENKNDLQEIRMQEKVGYTIRAKTIHRVEAAEDSFILEVSSKEEGITFRLEDDYARGDEIK